MLSKESITNRFGSRRGFFRHYQYSLQNKLGRYRSYKDIDWGRVERLVFVCKGNICRSAFAEAVAKSEGLNAISCGIDTIENAPANERAMSVAQKFGYNLVDHKTTPIQQLTFSQTDLLVAMEPPQGKFLEEHLGRRYPCTLLGLWFIPSRPYIHDPYDRSLIYFENCFHCIEESVYKIVSFIKETSKIR